MLIAIILLVATAYFVTQRSGATEITQTGNNVSIAIGQHRLQATKVGSEYSDSFLIVGGMEEGDLHFNALLSVIPLETAQLLTERYGNFRQCSSPGAAAGMNSVLSMALYAANPSVERKLKKINKLSLAGKDPIIKMSFIGLEITDHMIEQGNHTVKVQSDIAFYLVTEVKLVQQGMEL